MASPALQHRLCALASTAAYVTEFTAPAAPVLLVLLEGAFLRREAETVERLTADLTEDHLMLPFTGTEQTDRLRRGWDRSENTEAAH